MSEDRILLWIATLAAIVSAAYEMLAYHRRPQGASSLDDPKVSRRFLLLRWAPTAVAVGAVGFGYFDKRSGSSEPRAQRRDVFERETLRILDLVGDGPPTIIGKNFSKCIIRGPGFLKMGDHNTFTFCAVSDVQEFLTLPEGSPIVGAVFLSGVIFSECYFDGITFVGTSDDTKRLSTAIASMPLADWKSRVGWS